MYHRKGRPDLEGRRRTDEHRHDTEPDRHRHGVAGTGKTTIGRALADRLGWAFAEGDAFHPPSNVAKMAAGTPLTDADRWPWLDAIASWIGERLAERQPAVVACSPSNGLTATASAEPLRRSDSCFSKDSATCSRHASPSAASTFSRARSSGVSSAISSRPGTTRTRSSRPAKTTRRASSGVPRAKPRRSARRQLIFTSRSRRFARRDVVQGDERDHRVVRSVLELHLQTLERALGPERAEEDRRRLAIAEGKRRRREPPRGTPRETTPRPTRPSERPTAGRRRRRCRGRVPGRAGT